MPRLHLRQLSPSIVERQSAEEDALASGLEVLALRFGRFWGPGTWATDRPPEPPFIHVAEAGRRAAALIVSGRPGVHVLAEPAAGPATSPRP